MDYLTVSQYAELKGCSIRTAQRNASSGKIEALKTIHVQNNKECFMIPITSLTEDLQAKYYSQKRLEAGLPPISKDVKKELKHSSKPVRTSLEEFSEAEREEIAKWTEIVKEWQHCRNSYPGNKTEADKLYIGKFRLEHPETHISTDILYRKYAAYKNNELQGLCENRGGANKGKSRIPKELWEQFEYLYLSENRPTVSRCYELTKECAAEYYPETIAGFTSERSFRRETEKIPQAVIKYLREGDKAMKDSCIPYICRMYDELHANDVWIADNHTLDIQSINEETGAVHRLYLTAFLDAKSGVLVGWNIAGSASSQSTVLALRHGILRFGSPKIVYFDNGREFLTDDIGGKGHRTHKNSASEPKARTILQRLDITMRNAIVRNAQAKPIERTFSTVTLQFSKMFEGYCGGTIFQRPESLKRRIKNGQLPCDFEIREYINDFIDHDYNVQAYGGDEAEFKGMSRIDVWNRDIQNVGIRRVPEAELNLMLMRSEKLQKIQRNGVFVNIGGEKIWFMDYENTFRYLGRKVYVRYDPAMLTSVRIYDENDKYLWTWECADKLLVDFITETREEISDAMAIQRRVRRFIKAEATGILDGFSNDHKLDLMEAAALKAQHGKDKFRIQLPSNEILINSGESCEIPIAAGSDIIEVDLDLMNSTREKRIQKWKGDLK